MYSCRSLDRPLATMQWLLCTSLIAQLHASVPALESCVLGMHRPCAGPSCVDAIYATGVARSAEYARILALRIDDSALRRATASMGRQLQLDNLWRVIADDVVNYRRCRFGPVAIEIPCVADAKLFSHYYTRRLHTIQGFFTRCKASSHYTKLLHTIRSSCTSYNSPSHHS